MRFLVPGLLASILVLSCEFGHAPTGGGTGAEGVLQDSRGTVLGGARVRVYPTETTLSKGLGTTSGMLARIDSTTSGSDGAFRFSDLPSGTYNLEASFKRNDTVLAVFVPGLKFTGSTQLGVRTLQPAATIWVFVNDADDQPLPGAFCEIPGSPWQATSDSVGTCEIKNVAVGLYSVRVSAGGQSVVANDVEVVAGQPTTGCQVTFDNNGEAP